MTKLTDKMNLLFLVADSINEEQVDQDARLSSTPTQSQYEGFYFLFHSTYYRVFRFSSWWSHPSSKHTEMSNLLE